MHKNQNGIAAVAIVAIVGVVGLIGVAGWFVLGRDSKKESSESKATTTTEASKQEQKPEQTSNNTGTTQPAETPQTTIPEANKASQGFLTINEWGVKIPLTAEIANSYYVYENGGAYLRVDIPGDTQNTCSNQAALAKVTDYSESYDNWRQKPSELEKVGVKIGDAYYFIEGSQSACSEDEAVQSKATAIRRAWLNQNKFIVLK